MEASKPRSGVPWPHAVSLVVAAEGPHQRDWALTAAIEIARKLAGHRKVVLVDAGAGGPSLAEKLGVGDEAGIVDVLFRGASFSVVAQRPAGETFFFLPLGPSAAPPEALFHHPRWLRIAERLAGANAHLLTCVLAGDWLSAGPISGFESCIILNGCGRDVELPVGAGRFAEFLAPPRIRATAATSEPDDDAGEAAEAVPVEQQVGRVEPRIVSGRVDARAEPPRFAPSPERVPVVLGLSEPENSGGAAAYRETLGRWRSRVSSPRLDPLRRRIAAGAAVVAVVVTAAILWAAFGAGGGPEEGAVFEAVAETTTVAEPVPPPAADEDLTGGRPRGVSLPYSVAIASYSSFEDALARQKKLARKELTVYVAPTPVRGVVYYRVFAGLLAERSEAEALMAQLVREGIKDTVRAWDVRQAQYTFSFGTYASVREAGTRVETLLRQGIHAYTVPVRGEAAEGQTAYHVYAGGYETREAAGPLREQIEAAGLSAELVERVGLLER